MQPLVSVLLPLYKERIDWIRLSIESILSQTYEAFELLLINDNPENEDNINLIREYENLDSRVKGIFHKKNMGLPQTLNNAVTLTQGTYIARMDADDISMPTRFEEQVKYLTNHPQIGVVGSYGLQIDENGNISNKLNVYEVNGELKALTLFATPFLHPVVMFRKDFLLENLYDTNCRIWQDRELWCRIKDKTDFYNIPKILIKYRVSSFQAPQKAGKKKTEESIRYFSDKVTEYWHIDVKYKETYYRIAAGENIDPVELDNFFDYLMENNKINIYRYFIIKKYIECKVKDGKHFFLCNRIAFKYPNAYIKTCYDLFIRLVRKKILMRKYE